LPVALAVTPQGALVFPNKANLDVIFEGKRNKQTNINEKKNTNINKNENEN